MIIYVEECKLQALTFSLSLISSNLLIKSDPKDNILVVRPQLSEFEPRRVCIRNTLLKILEQDTLTQRFFQFSMILQPKFFSFNEIYD